MWDLETHFREALPNTVILPEFFKKKGYYTQAIGKVNHNYPPILDPPSWSVPESLLEVTKRDEYLSPGNRVDNIDPHELHNCAENNQYRGQVREHHDIIASGWRDVRKNL